MWRRRGLLYQTFVHIHDHFVLVDDFGLTKRIVILLLELECKRILQFERVQLVSFLRFLGMDSLSDPLDELGCDSWILAEMNGTDAHCFPETVSDLEYLLCCQ